MPTRLAPRETHQVAGEGKRAPRFKDVVDEQDLATGDIGLDVAKHRDLAGGNRPGAIARQGDELDLGR